MKREILFRGKRIDNGEWLYGNIQVPKPPFDKYFMWKYKTQHEVKPSTVGQFIGLPDNNGVKIFEGDIVTDFRGNKFEVVFYDKNLSFELSQMQTGVIVPFTTWDYNVEVIGNIHDNTINK